MAVDLRPPPTVQTPRRSAARQSSGTTAKTSPTPSQMNDARTQERKDGLDQYVNSGVAIMMIARQHADAQALATHGPKITGELATLANTHEKLGSAIDKAIAASPFAGLVMAVMPLAMQLAVNHGFIKNPGVLAGLGIQPKESLEAEGRQAEQRLMLEALKAQKAYEEEQLAFQRELAEMNGGGSHGVSE
jgi:hypothetical protein